MHQVEIVDFPYSSDAEPLFQAIRELPDAIWLDSGKPRSLYGRFDIITAQPNTVLETTGSSSRIITKHSTHTSEDDPFQLAEQLSAELSGVDQSLHSHPFVGGLAGFFGYDLGRRLESIPNRLPSAVGLPDMRLGSYPWALVLNHSAQKAWLFFHQQCSPELKSDIGKRLKQALKVSTEPALNNLEAAFAPTIKRKDYLAAINRIQDYIAAGDCYQVNFAQHFSTLFEGDSWDIYRQLRRVLPSPYSSYYSWDNSGKNSAILCLSPERFLKLSMGQVETKPIKGTIARGQTVEEDQNNAIRLMNSAKDRAENLMIVDLLRNDLGKTCVPGSIRVPKLFALESFPNVHHLVSTVTGTLADEESALSLLRGCFPGGSITGAPKKRAMEIIEELEQCRRSVYCGSMGYISATGRMDTNIAIRTLVADGNRLHCWGGGGIVADSTASGEYQESLDKVRVLMDTLANS